jgi:hypothetical protein
MLVSNEREQQIAANGICGADDEAKEELRSTDDRKRFQHPDPSRRPLIVRRNEFPQSFALLLAIPSKLNAFLEIRLKFDTVPPIRNHSW